MGHCFHQLRKQSDLQLIRCVQDNVKSNRSYFVKPPLSSITLFFRQGEMEREYRDTAHRVSERHGDSPPTLATSRFNTYFDIFISALVNYLHSWSKPTHSSSISIFLSRLYSMKFYFPRSTLQLPCPCFSCMLPHPCGLQFL